MGKCVVLHKGDKVLVAKRICCNVNSNIVVGSLGPLGDSHVAVQISFSLSMEDVLDNWRYSIRAWLIELVYYNRANFWDHELRVRYKS